MCDETFKKLSEEAMRLAKTRRVVTRKKKQIDNVRKEVYDLKQQIDNVTSSRPVASQQ